MKKVLIALLLLVVVAASGYGGWWYAAEKGMIAGKPNSPRTENFELALNEYFSRRSNEGYFSRSCVRINSDSYSASSSTYKDTRFDYTPAGFRTSGTVARDPGGNRKAQLDYMEKQGFFTSKPNAEGGTDYEMTWKGYAAANNGCFHVQGVERIAKIIGFEKKRTDNGVDIYEVTASSPPKAYEAWTQTQEFKDLFPQHAEAMKQLNPNPVAYELARTATGFVIISVAGKEYRPAVSEQGALTKKMAGILTADRVKKAVDEHLAKTPNVASSNRVCLRLPGPSEVDEIGPVNQMGHADPGAVAVTYDIYNLPGRSAAENNVKLRGYAMLRRFEALNLAKSMPLNYSEFRGMAALGGMRFEFKKEVADQFSSARGGCYMPVTLQAEEIIRFDQFNENGRNATFTARMSLKPVDEEAKRIIGEFGHLSRALAVGVPMTGGLVFKEGQLQVAHTQVRFPEFQPDISSVTLPAISVGLTRPPAAAMRPGNPVHPGSYTLSVPYRGPLGSAAGNAATPGALEVHSVRVYEGALPNGAKRGFQQHPEGTVTVQVWPTRSPAGIFLASYEPVNWVIQVKPGARIGRVVTSGYHPQRVTFIGTPGAPVSTMPYTGDSGQNPQQAARAFGITPKSAQYVYTGKNFEVGK